MKSQRWWLLGFFLLLCSAPAHAGRADIFRGWYEVLSPKEEGVRNYLVIDTDILSTLWARYAKTPLPERLEPLKNDPTIIAFAPVSSRNVLFLTLERVSLVSPNYLSLPGGTGEQLELKRAGDGTFEAAVMSQGVLTRLRLAAPVPPPPPREGL